MCIGQITINTELNKGKKYIIDECISESIQFRTRKIKIMVPMYL